MPVPLLDLQAQLSAYRDAAFAAITRVVDAQHFILGPEVTAFERELASYMGLAETVGMSSGTDALLAALMALDIGPGDEVVTTPFSFFATAGVAARLGAKPVFADIDPETFNLSEAAVRAVLTPNTRAIIPVHLYGRICDLGTLYDEPGRPAVVEDAAQALGAKLRGRGTGEFGAMTCVSFFPSKNLGAFGDGGAVGTQDRALAERLRVLRVHGSKPKYYHHIVGGNFRLDALQAAVLRVKLPFLAAWEAGRQRNAERYRELFAAQGLVERGLVVTPQHGPEEAPVYNQFVIRAARRDELQASLTAKGIETMVYYPRPLHLQPCFAGLGYGPGDFPHAERACAEVLALPIYPELTEQAQDEVVAAIAAFYGV